MPPTASSPNLVDLPGFPLEKDCMGHGSPTPQILPTRPQLRQQLQPGVRARDEEDEERARGGV
jgi:hypothetical protein